MLKRSQQEMNKNIAEVFSETHYLFNSKTIFYSFSLPTVETQVVNPNERIIQMTLK